MPDYPPLLRHVASSQAPSTHTQRSIRHRSGAHQSPQSLDLSASSRHATVYHASDVPQSAGDGQFNGHPTVPSPSRASHFTAIPARSRRLSIVSSRSAINRPPSRPAASTMTEAVHPSPLIVPLSANDHAVASSGRLSMPVASSTSYLSQVSVKIRLFARQMSSLTCSGLDSLRRNIFSPLPNARLPIFNSNRPAPPKALVGPNGRSLLSTEDKLTHKWPRPRSSRSIPPGLRTNPYEHRHLRALKGAGGWSQDDMEAILRDSRGLGTNWVGQWTMQKWCLLASVTTVFLLGLSSFVLSVLTWFAGKTFSLPF
jgi:hypothetical protein